MFRVYPLGVRAAEAQLISFTLNERWLLPPLTIALSAGTDLSLMDGDAGTGLILMDGNFIDVSSGGEGELMINAIGSSSISSISSLSMLISRLSDTPAPGFLVIPKQEPGSISLTSEQQSLLAAYVSSGGRLVVACIGNQNSLSLLNSVFGWSLSASSCSTTSKVSGPATCDFGHASLPDANAIYCLETSSLPASSTVYYESGSGGASVVMWRHGIGMVIGLAPDFYEVPTAWGDVLRKCTTGFNLVCENQNRWPADCKDTFDIIGDVSYIGVKARLQQRGLNVSDEHLVGAEMRNWSNNATVTFDELRVVKKAGASFSILFELQTPFVTHSTQTSSFDVLPYFEVVKQLTSSSCGKTESISIGIVDSAGEEIRVYEEDSFFMYVSPGDGFNGYRIEDEGVEQRQRHLNSSELLFDDLVIRRDHLLCLGDFRLKFTVIIMRGNSSFNSSFNSSTFPMKAYDLVIHSCGIRFSEVFQVSNSDRSHHSKFLTSGLWNEELVGAGDLSLSPPSYFAAGGPAGFGHVTFDAYKSQYLDAGARRLDIASNGGFTILATLRFNGKPGDNETVVSFCSANNQSHVCLARSRMSGGISVKVFDGSKLCSLETEQEWIKQGEWITLLVRFDKKSKTVAVRVNDDFAGTAECSADLADVLYSDIHLGGDLCTTISGAGKYNDSGSFLSADVVGVHIADKVLTLQATTAVHEKMVQDRNAFPKFELPQGNLPVATLAMVDFEARIIASSSAVFSATLQTQSSPGACDDKNKWVSLPNLRGTVNVVAEGGYAVFTDLHVNDVARECLRIHFSLDGYLNKSSYAFRMFPSLHLAMPTQDSSNASSPNIALIPWMRLGQAVEAIRIYSSDALGFKLEAELQSCWPEACNDDINQKEGQACRSRRQEALSPMISNGLFNSTTPRTNTEIYDGLGGFLEIRAASVIVGDVHRYHLFPSSLNTFRVRLAFNVNITRADPFIITLSGIPSATKDDANFTVVDADSAVAATSDWFSRAEWKQAGGRLVLYLSASKSLTAGHQIAFRFSLLNGRFPPSKLEPHIETTGQHVIPLVAINVSQPVTIASPRLEAAANYVNPWSVRSNRINIRLLANFNLRDSESYVSIGGLKINPSCRPFEVNSSCGHDISEWTQTHGMDLVLTLSSAAPAAMSECNISIGVESVNEIPPLQNLSVSFVAKYFIAKTSALVSPIVPTFVVKRYGMRVRSSSSSSTTISLTLVANIVLKVDDSNKDLVFRIWGLSSEANFPVLVSIYDRLEAVSTNQSFQCHPAALGVSHAHVTACQSKPSCRRNATCTSPFTGLCGRENGNPYPMNCNATALQLGTGDSASQSFVLRGLIPAGNALVLQWQVKGDANLKLNLSCSAFGETIFALDDTLQQRYGYALNHTRVPDFVHTKIGQTTSWPMTKNHIHITLVAGHIIPSGSLLTISGIPEHNSSALERPFEILGSLAWSQPLPIPPLNVTNITNTSSGGILLESKTYFGVPLKTAADFVFQAVTDILRGDLLEIVVPVYNPSERTNPAKVFVRVSRVPTASTSMCPDCFLGNTALVHDESTILPVLGAMPGDAAPMKVQSLTFLTLAVGQHTTFPSANNTISLTMITNANFQSGANLVLTSLDEDGAFEQHKIIHEPIVAGVQRVFEFSFTNPSAPRAAAKFQVQLFSNCTVECFHTFLDATNAEGDLAPLFVKPPGFETASVTATSNFPVMHV
jgi:hypothetical protein